MSKKCSFLYGTLAVVLGVATGGSMVGPAYATDYSGSETIDLSADITDGIPCNSRGRKNSRAVFYKGIC